MISNTSPTRIPTVDEQLLALRKRRSVVDRLVRCLEEYGSIAPATRIPVRSRVA